jgi:hypothetical protein
LRSLRTKSASLTPAAVEKILDGNAVPNPYELNTNVSAVSSLSFWKQKHRNWQNQSQT